MSAGEARFHRVEELFQAALELPSAERAAYLERAADGDQALAAEVAALLDEDDSSRAEGAADLIGAAVASGAREVLASALPAGALAAGSLVAGSLVGRRIGPWFVKDLLGQGGISTVYLALRADEQFRKRVALKVLKRGMDTDEILLRFRNERQILASLEHPNIARLIDAGSTEEGLSYFVMEYVEGVPLDRYCDAQRLGVEARLELFEAVCSAVAYAHRNLVVHRDLKPSNILVTPQGVPKLLDFGIAKLLNPELTAGSLEPTLVPWSPMTPSYASPEQVRGESITTATDVYSLGVLLCELLCGRRPYSVSARQGDLERVMAEVEPEPPSVALARPGKPDAAEPEAAELARRRNSDAKKLLRRLGGDLDTVVLTALRKEPQRRYASAEHMADDLRRHLRGLPIAARRESFRYQAGKFLRRHRAGAAAAAAALVLGTLFVGLLAVQSVRLARERTVSEQERRRAETVSEFLVELFQVSEPGEALGGTVTARELLERGAERVAALDGQPLVQATLMQTIGRVYEQLGLYDDAAPLLERAVALRREHLGPEHADVAESLNRLAVLRAKAGSYDLAEPLFRKALEIRVKAFGDEDQRVADSLNNLALLLHEKGDYGAAEELYLRAARLEEALPRDPEDPFSTRSNLALLYHDQGRHAQAEPLYRQALSRAEQVGGPRHPEVARLRGELGVTLLAAGREEAAEDLLRQAVELRREVLGPRHPDLARSLRQLATLLVRQGRLEEAIPLHREALGIRRLAGGAHPEVADSLAALAEALAARGERRQAVEHLSQALAIYRNALPAVHPFTADVLVALGRLRCESGEAAAGEALLREGVGIRRQALPPGDPRVAEAEVLLERCRSLPRGAGP